MLRLADGKKTALLAQLLAYFGSLQVGLFINEIEPEGSDTLANLAEATFPGYVRKTLANWSPPYLNANNDAQSDPSTSLWTMTDDSPINTVYGYFTVANDGGLVWSARLDTGPVVMDHNGAQCRVTASMGLLTATCPDTPFGSVGSSSSLASTSFSGSASGSGTIFTQCCGRFLVPAELHGTWTALPGGTLPPFFQPFNMVFTDPGNPVQGLPGWYGGMPIIPHSPPFPLALICTSGGWGLNIPGNGAAQWTPADVVSCAPFMLQFTVNWNLGSPAVAILTITG